MKTDEMTKKCLGAACSVALSLTMVCTAGAQVAGSSSIGVTVTETDRNVMGWSARESILGQPIYNEDGEKIGKVEDLIVDVDRNVSYLIVAVGRFDGIKRHVVAVLASQIRRTATRMILPGASRQALATLPPFVYSPITRTDSSIVDSAERDVAAARQAIARLEGQSATTTGEPKDRIDRQIGALRHAQKLVEDTLVAMKKASADTWKLREGEVRDAAAQLRLSIRSIAG